jgi:acyl-coenzyme A thioesterase 13
VGAIATLIDNVGAATIYSSIGVAKVSVELNISYYSTAKIQVCSLILS